MRTFYEINSVDHVIPESKVKTSTSQLSVNLGVCVCEMVGDMLS